MMSEDKANGNAINVSAALDGAALLAAKTGAFSTEQEPPPPITPVAPIPMTPEMIDAVDHYETVEHPKHYNSHPSGVECIDIIEEMSFNCGAAVKHIWRNGIKPGTNAKEDLRKAIFYLTREIDRIERHETAPEEVPE